MDTKDRNFSFNLDFSQVKNSASVATEGFYQCEIKDIYVDRNYNENRIEFSLTVSAGEQKGNRVYGNMLKPGSYEGKDNSYYWMKFYLSLGVPETSLSGNGNVPFNPSDFVGKTCHVFFRPADKASGIYSKLDFFSPQDWKNKKTVSEASQGSAINAATRTKIAPTTVSAIPQKTVSIPTPIPSTPQAGFASDNTSGSDILSFLNAPQAK